MTLQKKGSHSPTPNTRQTSRLHGLRWMLSVIIGDGVDASLARYRTYIRSNVATTGRRYCYLFVKIAFHTFICGLVWRKLFSFSLFLPAGG